MRVRWPQPWLRNQVRISGSRRKWTDSFLWGSTRRACAQSGRITLESGSDATARSMSSSRSARTRRQSVLPLRAEANRFVIFLPLTSPCPSSLPASRLASAPVGSKEAQELFLAEPRLFQNAVLQEARRNIAAVHRNRDATFRVVGMKQPRMAAGLVVDVEPRAKERSDHLLRFEDWEARHAVTARA